VSYKPRTGLFGLSRPRRRKDTGPATRQIEEIVLKLGVVDVAASKRFYVDRGFTLTKSYPRRYVEFAPPSSSDKLTLYRRRALAKVAGVSPAGRPTGTVVANITGRAYEPSSNKPATRDSSPATPISISSTRSFTPPSYTTSPHNPTPTTRETSPNA